MHGVMLARLPGSAVAALLLGALPLQAQACPDAAAVAAGLQQPLATVRYLADDSLEGRLAGSPGERCAGDYIAARFRALGLRGAAPDGGFFQDVPLASTIYPHALEGTGRNVLALLEGSDPALRDQLIVIGAHYDHLGRGAFGSAAPDQAGDIHNGADDNASGVAAMLHAAELLATGPAPARTILFIAFTGEEAGLLGSAHFVREPVLPLERVRAMLNLDMVGRLEDRPLIVYGTGTALEWLALLEPAAAGLGVEVAARPEGFGPSDHTSFYRNDIPVLHFFTNTHGDYHRPGDDWDRIDADGLERVARLVAGVAGAAASNATTLTLVRGVEPVRTGGAASGRGRASLGTIPDFTPVPRGVLLGGVAPGSAGERAGLRKGDVLIRLGDHEIADLEAFNAALQAHEPGDEVVVIVLRDGVEVRTTATLGSRSR